MGRVKAVLKSCKNMQDLIVESTPLTTEDEQQIAAMVALKTIEIKDLQNESLTGSLSDEAPVLSRTLQDSCHLVQPSLHAMLDYQDIHKQWSCGQEWSCVLINGIPDLVNVEKLVFDNIKMNEATAKQLAEGFKNLKKLHVLNLSHLRDLGDGMTDIVNSISLWLKDLKEIHLVNCCLSGTAVNILAQNLSSLCNLYALNLSDNFLGNDGKEALHKLVDSLNVLPKMKELMLPWEDKADSCLIKLLQQLERMPQLTKLGLKKWTITDSEAGILGK
ncbi:UNVERIFIED_CONTAM: hypothetical protein K2H54_057435 [Gekko kuhli]